MANTLVFILLTLYSVNSVAIFGLVHTPQKDALFNLKQHATIKQQTYQNAHQTYKILIWNVYKEAKKSFQEEYQRLHQQYRPEITLLQEATLNEQTSCLDFTDCYFSQAFNFKNKGFGVLTSSKYQILHAKALHSDSLEPILYTPKTTLVTVIQIENQKVMIINTHGINFVGLNAYEKQLTEIVDTAKEFNGPILWAGDFNSWRAGRYDLLQRAASSLELKEVDIENPHLIKGIFGFKLDRVFSRDLNIYQAQAISSKGSDHNPIIVEIPL